MRVKIIRKDKNISQNEIELDSAKMKWYPKSKK